MILYYYSGLPSPLLAFQLHLLMREQNAQNWFKPLLTSLNNCMCQLCIWYSNYDIILLQWAFISIASISAAPVEIMHSQYWFKPLLTSSNNCIRQLCISNYNYDILLLQWAFISIASISAAPVERTKCTKLVQTTSNQFKQLHKAAVHMKL